MKTLIITGCNGQLGRAINKELEGSSEYKLVNTDVEELDITDVNAVLAFVREHKPYAILNCAAYTAVEACETERDLAYKINAVGPRNLSLAAAETGAKLVQVSTDYVFAGDGDHPYEEFDLTYPQGVYGASKLAGENYVREFAGRYFIIRTAWLYGEGKNFVRTMLRLSETNDKVRVVNDQFGCPTSDNYGLFHGTCEGSCSWADFASEIFRLAGKSTVVEGISTEEYGAKVKRPAYSVLDNYMFRLTTDFQFAHWKDALREYMEETV